MFKVSTYRKLLVITTVLLITFSQVQGSTVVRVVDDLGRKVEVRQPVSRVISIQPSTTEIIFALNASRLLVGRTDFCDYPEEVKNIPSIGGVSNPSPDRIISLRPNIIFTSTMFPKAMAEPLMRAYPLIVLEPNSIKGIYDNITTVGSVLQRKTQAEQLINSMEAIRKPIESYFTDQSKKPTILTIVWHDPLITVGPSSFVASIIEEAGGINYIQRDLGAYPMISPESLLQNEPDIILYPTKSMGLNPSFLLQNPFKNLKAVRNLKVFPIDDDLLFRPGPRVIQGLVEVAKAVEPELKNFDIYCFSTRNMQIYKNGKIIINLSQITNHRGRIFITLEQLREIIKNQVREIRVNSRDKGTIFFSDGRVFQVNLLESLFPLRVVVEALQGKIFWNHELKEIYFFLNEF